MKTTASRPTPLMTLWVLFCSGLFLGLACPAFGTQGSSRIWGQRPGYLDSVEQERRSRQVELTVVSAPSEDRDPLRERIFNDRLSREFQAQYEQRFGRTQAERQLFTPNRFAEYEYSSILSVSFVEDQENKQRFGEYMMRRLVEYHVDDYAKSNPSVRPVYELKDRIANVDMEVRPNYKFRFRYSYSGNYVDVFFENPLGVDTRLSLMMDPGSFGPTQINESILSLRYPLDRNITVSYHYKLEQGVWSLIGERRLSSSLSATLSGATYSEGTDGEDVRQNLVLLGLSWLH